MSSFKMPQSEGGYFSLENGPESVYNSTTEPSNNSKTVLETVKRVIGQVMTGAQSDQNLLGTKINQPYIINAR